MNKNACESLFSYTISSKSNLSCPTEPLGGPAPFLRPVGNRPMQPPPQIKPFSNTKAQGFFKNPSPQKNAGLQLKIKKPSSNEKSLNKTMPKGFDLNSSV